MQPGKRQLRLGLDARDGEQLHVGGALACILQQRRLADARLTAHEERAAGRAPGGVEQRTDPGTLVVAAIEHDAILRSPPPGIDPAQAAAESISQRRFAASSAAIL
jgi:hypothetical protein